MAYQVLAALIELRFLQLSQSRTQPGQVLWSLTGDVQECAVGQIFIFAVVQKTPVQPGITQLGWLEQTFVALESILFLNLRTWTIQKLDQHGSVHDPGRFHRSFGGVAALQFSLIMEQHLLKRPICLQLHLRLGHNHCTGKEMLLQTFTFHTSPLIS